jgi:hypothetical protein
MRPTLAAAFAAMTIKYARTAFGFASAPEME